MMLPLSDDVEYNTVNFNQGLGSVNAVDHMQQLGYLACGMYQLTFLVVRLPVVFPREI